MKLDQNNGKAIKVEISQLTEIEMFSPVQTLVHEKERMTKIHRLDVDEVHSSTLSLEGDLCETQDKERVKSESFETTSMSDDETSKVSDDGSNLNSDDFFSKICNLWCLIYGKYSFLVLICFSVILAFVYPPLGAIYVQPQITASWCAVIFIFVLSGLTIRTEEFKNALTAVRFNIFVQVFNFWVVSALVFGISRFMLNIGALDVALADGMTICSCLPTSIGMVMTLTINGKGDEAAAVFHSAIGSMIGVFLTPIMIFWYLGDQGTVNLLTVVWQLVLRVFVPIILGQLLRLFCTPVKPFLTKYKQRLNGFSEWALVFIVYTVFCKTFIARGKATLSEIFLMIGVISLNLVLMMVLSWGLLRVFFHGQPKLQVMGLFGCTHKTIAMGAPLINALYPSSPLVGLYTLPIVVWYPMQLFLGSLITPWLASYVEREGARISGKNLEEINSAEQMLATQAVGEP